ncbi:hypothetical protein [Fodinicola feengrottensis]|uniref:Uncharacterized protein n=1 Tax=Fodinicola feengrottensis TaxID=435914 RepID=A0ABP4S1H2_9ACTN|nr:hypothetical protein [Fodinicola feengrottensis]
MSSTQPSEQITELAPEETYNPWTVVNVVFHHLVDKGLHPVLGGTGNPGEPATALLRAMGITPTVEGDARTSQNIRNQLADLRTRMLPQQLDEP